MNHLKNELNNEGINGCDGKNFDSSNILYAPNINKPLYNFYYFLN